VSQAIARGHDGHGEQIGRDRGGFYSDTWLENLVGTDIHNVDHVIPALPDRRPGDTVWMAPAER